MGHSIDCVHHGVDCEGDQEVERGKKEKNSRERSENFEEEKNGNVKDCGFEEKKQKVNIYDD
jgi:hypothetical protein